jgi:hypothetical protein
VFADELRAERKPVKPVAAAPMPIIKRLDRIEALLQRIATAWDI